jgi:CubicO group peptidase (beta-lactamase class C family)
MMKPRLVAPLVAAAAALVAAALVACSHAPPPAATAPAAGHDSPLAAKVESLAQDALAHTPVAGFSITVVSHGEVVLSRGYGLADVEHRTPTAADSIFRIGSITKQFTAAAILQLAAAGKLSIDDKLGKYLPDFGYGDQITLRQLLTHTSGLKDYTALPWFDEHMADAFPRAELVAKIAAEPLGFTPGARWSYSNSGYYLLGLVIEKVSGQSYADYVQQHVLAPAGLADTAYCPPTQDYPRAAHGYQVKDAKVVPAAPLDMAHPYAAGSLCSTAPDLVAWMKALAHGKVVDAAAWQQMITPVALAGGKPYPYGFGLFVSDLGGHPRIGHGGGINGFVSALAYYPDDDLYVAVLVDTVSSLADELGASIARAALGVTEPPLGDEPIAAADAAALAGKYDFPDVGLVVDITVEDGQVFAQNEGGARKLRLRRQGDGSYQIPEAKARLVFELEDGQVKRLSVTQGGLTFTGTRVP